MQTLIRVDFDMNPSIKDLHSQVSPISTNTRDQPTEEWSTVCVGISLKNDPRASKKVQNVSRESDESSARGGGSND